MLLVPEAVFFVKGRGYHKSKLGSFEQALRDAGIAQFNLVKVSSIFPPHCIEISPEEGLKKLKPGQIVHTVMSRISSDEFNRLISASVGIAKPSDKKMYGYLSEHHSFGTKSEKVGEFSEDLAAEMLATSLGIPFDPEANYDEKQEIFRINDKIIETRNITQSANILKEKEWCTVISAAIFILP